MANNVYLFIGDEPLLITSKIERIIKNSRADEFNIVKYDGDETSISAIIQDALTPPFMANVKVIVIKNPIFLTNEKSQINHEVKDLIKYLNDDKSNYRITRESDGVVLRFSLYDMRKQEYENSRLIRGFKKRP